MSKLKIEIKKIQEKLKEFFSLLNKRKANFCCQIKNPLKKKSAEKSKILKKAENKIKFAGNYSVMEAIFLSVIRYFKWILIIAFILIFLSGIYKVDTGEVAVVLRFGKIAGDSPEKQIKKPGLHLALPFIIDQVVKIPVDRVQEYLVKTHYVGGANISPTVQKTGYLITGDNNIVFIEIKVKYNVKDPVAYAFRFNQMESIIDGVISGECTNVVAQMNVDDVLTTEKNQLANNLRKNSQIVFDQIQSGINISNIELTYITPPTETVSAFNEVNTAAVNKQTLIKKANEYQASLIPESQTKSEGLINSAKANQQKAMAKATKEIGQFNGYYDHYVLNPRVILNGTFRTRVSSVLKKSGAFIVVPRSGNAPRMILPNLQGGNEQ